MLAQNRTERQRPCAPSAPFKAQGASRRPRPAAAVRELGVPEEKALFEVLQAPQKKTLGLFGGCPARVRAYFEVTPASRAAEYLEEILRGAYQK